MCYLYDAIPIYIKCSSKVKVIFEYILKSCNNFDRIKYRYSDVQRHHY